MDEDKQTKREFRTFYQGESCHSESDVDTNSYEKGSKKDVGKIKKKEKNKDIGYAALDSQSSDDDSEQIPDKNVKPKRHFKFLQKKEEKEEKVEKKKKEKSEKDEKKKEKKREKEKKIKEKEERRKEKKEKKKKHIEEKHQGNFVLFGTPLCIAEEQSPCHDGFRVPRIVRDCIDEIEARGLKCEGIYRVGGSKSKIQTLRRSYNEGELVSLADHHPHTVATLLKQYLRELPETILTIDMMPHFEDVSLIPNPQERAESMRQLMDRLPTPNRFLLKYLLKHFGNVIESEEAKMSYHNICVILSPILRISHRVLNVMFHSHHHLVKDFQIKKYIPPISSFDNSKGSLDDLNSCEDITVELEKQESLLSYLHASVAAGRINRGKEEQLWEAQRNVTLLKRKLKNFPNFSGVGETTNSTQATAETQESATEAKYNSETDTNDTPSFQSALNQDRSSNKSSDGDHQHGQHPSDSDKEAPDKAIPSQDKDTSCNSKLPFSAIQTHPPTRVLLNSNEPKDNDFNFKNNIQGSTSITHNFGNDQSYNKLPTNLNDEIDFAKFDCAPTVFDESTDYAILIRENTRAALEQGELLLKNQELTKKLQFEKSEVARLRDEIQEIQTLYAYRTHSYDSSESEGSESEGENENEEEMLRKIYRIELETNRIQEENSLLVKRIHEEQAGVIGLKVALRLAEIKSI